MVDTRLDALDRAILHRLQADARESMTDIAADLDVSDNTIRNRIAKLEDGGAITGYQVNVDYDEVGVQHYYAFGCTARISERDWLAEAVRAHDCTVEVITLMTGRENLFVIAAAAEKDDITDLATELDTLGLTIEREHLVREHVRQPYDGFRLENNR